MLTASTAELQALLQLVQRAPMTQAEALFAEALFTRWLDQLAPLKAAPPADDPPGAGVSAADVLVPGASAIDQRIASPSLAVQHGAPLMQHADQVQST